MQVPLRKVTGNPGSSLNGMVLLHQADGDQKLPSTWLYVLSKGLDPL